MSEDDLKAIAKKVLLHPDECRIWLNHLQTVLESRRRGAKKAAATRLAKKCSSDKNEISMESNDWFCGDCGKLYEAETKEPEVWIECSLCSKWFHCSCESSTPNRSELHLPEM